MGVNEPHRSPSLLRDSAAERESDAESVTIPRAGARRQSDSEIRRRVGRRGRESLVEDLFRHLVVDSVAGVRDDRVEFRSGAEHLHFDPSPGLGIPLPRDGCAHGVVDEVAEDERDRFRIAYRPDGQGVRGDGQVHSRLGGGRPLGLENGAQVRVGDEVDVFDRGRDRPGAQQRG